MGSVNLVVTVESVRTLLTHKGSGTNALHIPSLVAVASALGKEMARMYVTLTKFLLR